MTFVVWGCRYRVGSLLTRGIVYSFFIVTLKFFIVDYVICLNISELSFFSFQSFSLLLWNPSWSLPYPRWEILCTSFFITYPCGIFKMLKWNQMPPRDGYLPVVPTRTYLVQIVNSFVCSRSFCNRLKNWTARLKSDGEGSHLGSWAALKYVLFAFDC